MSEDRSRSILLPIEDLTGVIQAFRTRFDPASEKWPPHISIVPAFSTPVGDDRVIASMDLACKNRLSFTIKLGPARLENGFVFLPAISQGNWLLEMHHKLSKKCGARPESGFSPRVIIGRDVSIEGQDEMKNFPKSMQVNVSRFVFAAEDAEGILRTLFEESFRIPKD